MPYTTPTVYVKAFPLSQELCCWGLVKKELLRLVVNGTPFQEMIIWIIYKYIPWDSFPTIKTMGVNKYNHHCVQTLRVKKSSKLGKKTVFYGGGSPQYIYIYIHIPPNGMFERSSLWNVPKRKVILLGTLGGQTLHVDIERLVGRNPC